MTFALAPDFTTVSCSAPSCEAPASVDGLCSGHLKRARLGQDLGPLRAWGKGDGKAWRRCACGHLSKVRELEGWVCSECRTAPFALADLVREALEAVLDRLTECPRCGAGFLRSGPQLFCSKTCRRASRPEPGRGALRRHTPEERRRYRMERRARKKNGHLSAARPATKEALAETWAEHGGLCSYCGEAEAEHWDHVVPLALGGTHGMENLVPACADCNLTKSAQHPLDFLDLDAYAHLTVVCRAA